MGCHAYCLIYFYWCACGGSGRAIGRTYGQVATKISRMHRLPNFLTHGARLGCAPFAGLRSPLQPCIGNPSTFILSLPSTWHTLFGPGQVYSRLHSLCAFLASTPSASSSRTISSTLLLGTLIPFCWRACQTPNSVSGAVKKIEIVVYRLQLPRINCCDTFGPT